MKVVPLYSPNCGAPVGKDASFCSQCGSPIVIDDGVKRSEHVHREMDVARLREADVKELTRLRELETEMKKEKLKLYQQIIMYVAFFIMLLLMGVGVFSR